MIRFGSLCARLVVLVLLIVATVPALAADAPPQGGATKDAADAKDAPVVPAATPATTGVQEVWDILLQSRMKELAAINAEADTLQKDLTAVGRTLNAQLTLLEREYQRIAAIGRVSRGLPVEQTVVSERLRRLTEQMQKNLAPLEGSLTSLQTRLTEISLLEKDAGGSSTNSGTESPELRDFLKSLQQTQNRISTLQGRINRALTPARNLLETVKNRAAEVNKAIPVLWRDYYLQSTGRLYDLETWQNMSQSLTVLRETFAVRVNAELPQSPGRWANVFIRGLFAFCPLYLLVLLFRKLVGRAPEGIRAGAERLSRHSLPWLCVGLSCQFAAWSSTGEAYHVLSLIGTLLMSLGQMALAWDLYTFDRPDLQRFSPLWPLVTPLLAGLLLLLFNLPAPMLSLIWILVLAGSIWYEHKRPTTDIPFPLVRNLLQMHSLVMAIAVVMAILGWGRLSILFCMSYAALAVCVQQAVGFMRIINVLTGYLPEEGLRALLAGVFLALAVPIILVVLTLATGLWILAYPGGSFLLAQFATLDFNVGERSFNMVQVLFLLSAFYVTRSIIAVGRSFLRELPQSVPIDHNLVGPIQVAYTYLLWGLFGLYALSALGFSLTSLAVVAGGLSVGIGFGLQNIINNFVSGLLVIFGQTLREGDVIEVGTLLGTVKKINVRSTIVETADNASIFVPNAEFLSGRLTNWTRNGRMVRREVRVGVAYGSDVRRVIELLMKVANDQPRVLSYPAPFVLFTDFGASTLDFALRFWIADINNGLGVETDVRIAIDTMFKEEGIEIAFPQLDVHLKQPEGAGA